MDNKDLISDLLPAYSLDCLDAAEAEQVTSHLKECSRCRQELQDYQELLGRMAFAVPEISPSPELREKILVAAQPVRESQQIEVKSRAVEKAPRRWNANYLWKIALPAWGVLSLIVILLLGMSNISLGRRLASLEAGRLGFQTVAMSGTETAPQSVGLLVISPDGQEGCLVVDGMPPLAEDQDYQLWLIRDGQRTSGGVFHSYASGYGVLWIHAEQPLVSYEAFGVTIEPSGGSPDATGDKIMGGSLN